MRTWACSERAEAKDTLRTEKNDPNERWFTCTTTQPKENKAGRRASPTTSHEPPGKRKPSNDDYEASESREEGARNKDKLKRHLQAKTAVYPAYRGRDRPVRLSCK